MVELPKVISRLSKFTGPKDEIDLILCRASMFIKIERLSTMTICPNHRAKLGLGWTRGSSTKCRVPERISNHGKGKGVWPRGERGQGKRESEVILRKTILGDPGAVSRFQVRAEEPLGTFSYKTSSKRSQSFWDLIGAIKSLCFSAQPEWSML